MRRFGRAVLFYVVIVLILAGFQGTDKIRYFQTATILLKPDHIKAHYVDFKDSLSSDTLFQIRSKEGYPISYFRKIRTGICFDNKCRLLDIVLYWNITGRYLGFELPEGEFLSKAEHEPFVAAEYVRLHEILANTKSPLGNVSYNQLVIKPDPIAAEIDGTSSATSPAVLSHVVGGAVYTTYQLWHLIHGTAKEEVQHLTVELLSPALISKILESPNQRDVMWALNHINGYINLTPDLRSKVVQFVNNDNYSLAERAINAINPTELRSDTLQLLLIVKFHSTNYSLKKLIIDKIKNAPELDDLVKMNLANNLQNLNGEILSRVLETFEVHEVAQLEVYQKIAELLKKDNYFISKKAYDFFEDVAIRDKAINRLLRKYEKAQSLPRR